MPRSDWRTIRAAAVASAGGKLERDRGIAEESLEYEEEEEKVA